MEVLEFFFGNAVIFQVISFLYDITLGAACCFGALKWRRGLITTASIGWGIFLGFGFAILLIEYVDASLDLLLLFPIIGMILLPILAYNIAGVNRFVLGYIVSAGSPAC